MRSGRPDRAPRVAVSGVSGLFGSHRRPLRTGAAVAAPMSAARPASSGSEDPCRAVKKHRAAAGGWRLRVSRAHLRDEAGEAFDGSHLSNLGWPRCASFDQTQGGHWSGCPRGVAAPAGVFLALDRRPARRAPAGQVSVAHGSAARRGALARAATNRPRGSDSAGLELRGRGSLAHLGGGVFGFGHRSE